MFAEFARISGFTLSLLKTVLVPLMPSVNRPALALSIAQDIPGWMGLQAQGSAKYLGFVIGPEAGSGSFERPFRKVLDRAAAWGRAGAGLFLTTAA